MVPTLKAVVPILKATLKVVPTLKAVVPILKAISKVVPTLKAVVPIKGSDSCFEGSGSC